MTEDRTNQSRFGGPYMIQDSDHMSGIAQTPDNAKRGARQSEQSDSNARQQGADHGQHNAGRRQAQ